MPAVHTRRQLAAALARRCGLTAGRALQVVDAIAAELGGALAGGRRAELRGLGSFVPRRPQLRQIRPVGARTLCRVPAGPSVVFRPGRRLRGQLAAQAPAASEGPA